MSDFHTKMALDMKGVATLPRQNGELLFEAPWQARAFGMAVALHEQGIFKWQEFQQHLIAAIKGWEASADEGAEYQYYERWLEALQTLLKEKNLCAATDVETRTLELSQRPPEHDQH